MKAEILRNKLRQHPDTDDTNTLKHQTDWTLKVPCEAYEAPIKGPSE